MTYYVYGPTDVVSPPGTDIEIVRWDANRSFDLDQYFHIGYASATRLGSGSPPHTNFWWTNNNWDIYASAAELPVDTPGPWSQPIIFYGGVRQMAFSIWHVPNTAGAAFTGLYLSHEGTPPLGTWCQYGSEKQYPAASVVEAGPAIAGILLPDVTKWWAIPLAVAGLVTPVALDTLCSGPPFADVDLEPGDFFRINPQWGTTVASDKIRAKIQRTMWSLFCRCQDGPTGSPPPTQPTVTNWNQPTWYISNTTNNISNYDIGPILNFYLNVGAGNQARDTGTAQITELSSGCTPADWVEGTVHADLLGTGRFDVSNVVGFKIEVVERNVSELVLSGQPMYLWNMGWVSVLADEMLLDEKRVTREGYLWFPCSIAHATTFTYTLRDITRLKVTELVKPPDIVLMAS